ncbi:DinB family protein [Spirosoma validum]|uniref:DinB family protein n=1 Tax=Spirosoma validum TaxID=2771355 RepID=A0A927GF78_9BACT|nr:DinB family protein [Spirosoma validum]MBD2755350.1 DinB family protein [Spirosoma validum]
MDALHRLRTHIAEVPARLATRSVTELAQKVPEKWSRKEILGHLIDSAINNLKRFTDAQFADGPYPIQSYSQNQLVIVNHYQDLPIEHLITLWQSLNTQIVYVVEFLSAETLAHPVQLTTSNSAAYTLGWLIEDYVVHLEHHLKTLL